jgi:predicted neuraminidase
MYKYLLRNISGLPIPNKKRFIIVKNTREYPKIIVKKIQDTTYHKSKKCLMKSDNYKYSTNYIPDSCKKCLIKRDNNIYNFLTGISLGCIIVQCFIYTNKSTGKQ